VQEKQQTRVRTAKKLALFFNNVNYSIQNKKNTAILTGTGNISPSQSSWLEGQGQLPLKLKAI